MALNKQKTGSSIFLDTTSAQYALDKLNKKIEDYDRKLKQSNLTARETAALQKKRAEEAAKAAAIQNQIEKGLGSTLQQQKKYVADLRKGMEGLAVGTKEYADQLNKLKGATKVLHEMKKELDAIGDSQKEAGKSSNFLSSFFGNVAANVVSKATAFVGDFFGGIKDETFGAEEAVSDLYNALENAGRTDAFERLIQSSDEFADRFKRLDNDDITGVFTKLVDYGKLTEKQIKELTPVIIDYAAKQKMSLGDATDALTKGLEGSAKGLKTYGINLKDATTFTERYGLIVGELGRKVNGAEEAFEKTNRGALEVFSQKIKNAQENVGNLVVDLLEAPKSADELFDEAKKQVDEFDRSLELLLPRYDELKGKTSLNKDEQSELNGIINKIVGIVPLAATEFDKYGRALDINRGKVVEFRKENAAFVQSREKDAIKELTSEAEKTVEMIEGLGRQVTNAALHPNDPAHGPGGTEKYLTFLQSSITKYQTALIEQTDKLINKYQVELPGAIKTADDAAREARFGEKKADAVANPNAGKVIGNGKTPEEEEAEKRAKEEAKKRAKEAQAEREREAKKERDDLQKLADEIRKIQQELSTAFQSDQVKEIAAAIEKYSKLKELAHGNFDFILKLDALQIEELRNINEKFDREKKEKQEENNKKVLEVFKSSIDDAAKLAAQAVNKLQEGLDTGKARTIRDRLAKLELDVIQSSGRSRIDAQKRLLQQQMNIELANEELTENEKSLIRAKYREQDLEIEIEFQAQRVEMILGYVQQALQIFETLANSQRANEDRELTRLQQRTEKERLLLKKQLNNKLISQQEYNKRISQLDTEEEKRKEAIDKKRFERDKKLQIAQAVVNGLMGITSVLAARPGSTDIISLGLFRAINIAFTVAATAAQVAAISKTKYAKGGLLEGPSHSENGLPVLNPKTGQVVAEVEGGEAILSKNTVKNNKQIVGALLNSSMKRNGATIEPFWKNRPYQTIDVPAISRSIRNVRHYQNGGTFDGSSVGSTAAAAGQPIVIPALSEEQMQMMQAFMSKLDQPLRAVVVLRDINEKQAQLDNLKNDAIFR